MFRTQMDIVVLPPEALNEHEYIVYIIFKRVLEEYNYEFPPFINCKLFAKPS